MNELENMRVSKAENIATLTPDYHCHGIDVTFAGGGDDGGLDFVDVASFVEILSQQSFHACDLFLDDHTFQYYDL